MGFADGGAECVGAESGAVFAGAGGHDSAAGHELDDIHVALGVFTGNRPYALGSWLGVAAEEVAVPPGVLISGPAVTMGGKALGAAQLQGQVAAVAEVADGGDSAA